MILFVIVGFALSVFVAIMAIEAGRNAETNRCQNLRLGALDSKTDYILDRLNEIAPELTEAELPSPESPYPGWQE